MPRRKALTVQSAAGPEPVVNQVLTKFGFDGAEVVATVAEALKRLHQVHYDLLIVPMDQIEGPALVSFERDLRREPATSVIGTGPSADPDLILRALRAGIHEFLVRPAKAEDLSAALDRMTRRVPADGKRGFVVAVYSPKGGLGVTTVAINLAFAIGKQMPERRVALADLVVGDADVRLLLNMTPLYDIGDLVARQEHLDTDVLFSVLSERPGNVWVLPASEKPETAEALDGNATTTIISQLRSQFGVVVLDCENQLREQTLAALDAADRVVLVTQLTIPALRSTQHALNLFKRLGYKDEKIWVVVNRYRSGEAVTLADAKTVLERDVAATLPNDYPTCAKAITKGVPLVEYEPGSKLGQQYVHIASRLVSAAVENTAAPIAAFDAPRAPRVANPTR